MKDGGPESTVFGYFLIEIKSLFSIVVLNFKDGSREAYHNHAFNAITWIFKGKTKECLLNGETYLNNTSFIPIITKRNRFHKVISYGNTWAIQFRGPWRKTWKEYLPNEKRFITLLQGRKIEET